MFEKCLNILVNQYGEGHIKTATTMSNLGLIFKDLE